MYRSILTSGLLAVATWAGAQQYVHQVLVLSEGYFDFNTQTQVEPVKLFAYDPVLGTTTAVATITGPRFGTHVQVHGGHIYVGADNLLLKYDADTYALVDQETVQGIRRFDFWNDKLILSRGEVGGLPHYLEVRDKNTLDLDYIVAPADGLEHSGEDVVVVGDKAYIAVNNGFEWGNAVGYVGVLDLVNESYSEVDLGPDGINPENLMVNGNELWTLNNKDFTGSSVSRINLVNGQHELTENLTFGSGCAASEMAQEKIYFMEYSVGQVARYDINSEEIIDTLSATQAIYGTVNDAVNNILYATTTDFFSTGELFTMDLLGNMTSVGTVGPNPGKLALDVRASQGLAAVSGSALVVAPNPAADVLFVQAPLAGNTTFRVLDHSGREVLNGGVAATGRTAVDVAALAPGAYVLSLGGAIARFQKL
ncbi:MAG: hypothetical protein IPJ76_15400 [Flavobacteriales bacterium]|nr:MAG: hypothetical protein IPJ76_15400 [Flavobacteriales bacterium]